MHEPALAPPRPIRTRLGTITISPLHDGDTHAVEAVVERLGARSRRRRFGKIELQPVDLALHACACGGRHVLVARSRTRPVALAHLVRYDDPTSAEAAVVVADEWQGLGIGRALARRLVFDAAAAGIGRIHALIAADNRASYALMRGATTIVGTTFEGADVHVVGEVAGPPPRRGPSLHLPGGPRDGAHAGRAAPTSAL
jgi:GNAT superfamily N-acetyltransferase